MSPMWYNLTSINATNILTFTQGVNTQLVHNALGIALLIGLFFVSVGSMNYFWDDKRLNLTVSLFFVATLGIMFVVIDLVPLYIVILFGTLFLLSLGSMFVSF